MELMVSVAILVIILLSVGVIFGGASRSVSNSQAIMEMLANVRAVQQVVEQDVRGMDKNGFLVIRSRVWNKDTTATFPGGPRFIDVSPYYDQISFVSLGSFPNRTGSNADATSFNSAFIDRQTVANAAHVWIGQMIREQSSPPDTSFNVSGFSSPSQGKGQAHDQGPTGAIADPSTGLPKENEFVLGIHHTALFPGPASATHLISPGGVNIPAYDTIYYDPGAALELITGANETFSAHITSSRFAVVAKSPSQLYSSITFPTSVNVAWDNLCYRFRTLSTVYDTEVTDNPFVNGYFRMHPIALPGTSSFKVEWSDGTTYSAGQPVWFSALNPNPDASLNVTDPTASLYGDIYIAAFSPATRAKWPKALRFTYHIVDANNRLSGGRDFTQVVPIP
jgi:hypothetical protein